MHPGRYIAIFRPATANLIAAFSQNHALTKADKVLAIPLAIFDFPRAYPHICEFTVYW